MYSCPHCHSPIPEEIYKFGGECGNCFKQIVVELGENADFEPTGMFTQDQFEHDEQSEDYTNEIELSELEIEDWDETTEIIEITDPGNEKETVFEVETLHSLVEINDDEPTMALTDQEILNIPPETDIEEGSVSQDLEDVIHQQKSELDNAEVKVPSINVPLSIDNADTQWKSRLSTEERNMVYEEDSEESFLTDETQPRKRVTPIRTRELKKIPEKPKTSSARMLVILGLFFVSIGAYWYSNKPVEMIETSTGQENYVIPTLPEVKVKEEEVVKDSAKAVVRTKAKKKDSQPVQRGGVQTFQTAAPVMRTKVSTAGATGNITENVEKDISKLRRNLKSCHDQVLKMDPLAAGKWRVQFKVSPSGKSSNISIKALRAKNPDIESCMSRRIGRFKFHGPSSTTPYDFRIVFGG